MAKNETLFEVAGPIVQRIKFQLKYVSLLLCLIVSTYLRHRGQDASPRRLSAGKREGSLCLSGERGSWEK